MEIIQGFHAVFFLWISCNKVLVTDAGLLFPDSISCNSSSLIQIDSIHVFDNCKKCPTISCELNQDDTNKIKGNCNNKTECQLPTNFTTTCLEEYGSYDISYDCRVLYTFENDDCGFTNVPGFDTKWFRSNGADQSDPKKNHTINSKNGYFMKISAETPGIGRMKTEELYNPGGICFSFDYQVFGQNFITFNILMKINNETNMFRYVDHSGNKHGEWQQWGPEPITDRGFFAIIFEGDFSKSVSGSTCSIAVDDILFGNCREMSNFSKSGVEINTPFTLQGCPSLLLNYSSIRIENLEDVFDNSCSLNYADILQDIRVYCNERPEIFCTFNLLELIGNQENCFSLRKELIINYSCKVNVTGVSSFTTSDAVAETITVTDVYSYPTPAVETETITDVNSYPTSAAETDRMTDLTSFPTLAAETETTTDVNSYPTSTAETDVPYDSIQSTEESNTTETTTDVNSYPTSAAETDVPYDSIQSTEESYTTGIAVGIVVGVVVLVVLISVVVYFVRRSKPDSSKPRITENISTDYTGHQNIAFPVIIEVNTAGQYDDLSPDNDEQHYTDIKEDRLKTAQDTLPHNYITIYDDKGVQGSNKHIDNESLRNEYACLDPSVTGYNRKGFSTIPKRDQQNNIKYYKAAVDDSDNEYAVVNSNESICHTEGKPATATSDNYTVLDPNETGFDRTKCVMDTQCPYEMARPIVGNDKNTEIYSLKCLDDPYELSGEETYNTTKDIRSSKLDDNVYSHSVDNVYDSASHTRKQNDNENAYDHFVGQKTEDDYDISKPK